VVAQKSSLSTPDSACSKGSSRLQEKLHAAEPAKLLRETQESSPRSRTWLALLVLQGALEAVAWSQAGQS
jgi:hypothetical protein